MGLNISTGLLAELRLSDAEGAEWLSDHLENVYRILAEESLPTFREPEVIAVAPLEISGGFPYSFLHYLRRAYALQREGLTLTPAGVGLTKTDDAVVEAAGSLFDSHLLTHSDAEGFYVPVDFEEPLFDESVPGAMLGSSYGLLRELIHLAPFLGIDVAANGDLVNEATVRAVVPEEGNHPYAREYLVWYTLYRAARFSIANGSAIVFG